MQSLSRSTCLLATFSALCFLFARFISVGLQKVPEWPWRKSSKQSEYWFWNIVIPFGCEGLRCLVSYLYFLYQALREVYLYRKSTSRCMEEQGFARCIHVPKILGLIILHACNKYIQGFCSLGRSFLFIFKKKVVLMVFPEGNWGGCNSSLMKMGKMGFIQLSFILCPYLSLCHMNRIE